ncbi:hypothetical protein BGZ95_004181 [Linnemannia exigua]|uniref:Uncharacterized protein n=1 Tax=Linnemannia exigua TaxID=604196 RepID=A0AAD4D3A8_9FUNG|nr:hypothetical protein BGZ95_004181 [Linnemannia exigua]
MQAQERAQAVYPVDHNGLSPSTGVAPAVGDIVYIDSHLDSAAGMEVIVWRDIRAMFMDAVFVRHNSRALDFLKDANGNTLFPLRVAALPRAVMEIVVEAQLNPLAVHVQSEVLLVPVSAVTPTTIREGPSSGSVKASTKNPTHNHSKALVYSQDDRELQDIPYHIRAFDKTYTSNNIASARISQGQSSASMEGLSLAEIMKKAGQGHKYAQNALGEMYMDGREVVQD